MTFDRERLERYGPETDTYTLAIITDEDQDSQVELEDGRIAWRSRLRYDRLWRSVDPVTGEVSYSFGSIPAEEGGEHQLMSLVAEGGRGAEFSELCMFGNRLVAFDDRTGLVCEVREQHQLIPRQILMTGSGDEAFKGLKCEWATLKDDEMIVGSHGKVATGAGGEVFRGPEEWVKRIRPGYSVKSEDWSHAFRAMRRACGVDPARGYVTHEAAEWNPYRREWLFFPRKISTEPFDEVLDERERGSNLLLVADESFSDVRVVRVGEPTPERGVSSIKIVPGHTDEMIGLKSVEMGDETRTYAFAFDLDGNILSDDVLLGDYKCEGVEFV